jgi:hypothetical protein
MAVTQFCDVSVPDFQQLECGSELGGIVAIAIIDDDEAPTLEQLRERTFWQSKLAASPQKYRVIKDTRGSYPGGTATEEEGYGITSTIRTGADHEATIEVRGIDGNRNFWAGVNQTAKWKVVLVTRSLRSFLVEGASIYGKLVIDQSIKSTLRWNGSIKWSDDLSNPPEFTAPTGIFF